MSVRNIVILAVLLAAVSYSAGRYLGRPAEVKTETKVDQVAVVDTHQQETITETKRPDGTDIKVTQITTVKDETDKVDTDVKTDTVIAKPKINLSLLATTSTHDPLGAPVYGISMSKEFIGPVTLGLFGLANGTIGVLLGVNF
jgi:hypothetical protein